MTKMIIRSSVLGRSSAGHQRGSEYSYVFAGFYNAAPEDGRTPLR